jgi:predicted regulator of Ras-like GTPase activity (Roadblock/LC7/MglB family)
MDAAQALADLTEISAQIEAAVLAQADGSVVASTFTEPSRGEELARAAADLVAAAGETGAGAPELVQLQAATPRGSVFVVRDPRHLVAAITGTKPTVGLVFYDLKTCLRMLEQQEAEPATEPEKAAAAAKPEKETAKESKVGKATGTRRRATTKKKDADDGT